MVKRTTVWTALVVLLAGGAAVWAEDQPQPDYWGKIKGYLEAYNKAEGIDEDEAAARAGKAYMKSLSPQQMIVAARQASKEVMEKVPQERWPEAGLVLSFFYQYYPPKVDNLSDVAPLLAEVKDASQPEFWRWWLVRALTVEWDGRGHLTDAQRRQVSDCLLGLAQQPEVAAYVRAEAISGVPRLMATMKKNLPPLKDGQEPGKPRQRFGTLGREYAQVAGALLAQKGISLEVQRQALRGLLKVHGMAPANGGAAALAIGKAARNFTACEEELWPGLMLAAFTTDPATDVAALVGQAETAAQDAKTADRLRKVKAVVAIKQLATQKPATWRLASSLRLKERTPEELLAMVRYRIDALALGSTHDETWKRLGDVLQEYKSRPRPAATGQTTATTS